VELRRQIAIIRAWFPLLVVSVQLAVARRAPAALRPGAAATAAPLASGAAVPEQRPVREASSAARLPAFSLASSPALSRALLPGRA